MEPLTVITVDDVVRAGACGHGIAGVVQRLGRRMAACVPVSQVLAVVNDDERIHVERAAFLCGNGNGYGNGDGNGNGNGNGDGYGDGYGYGYGYGDGDGDGDGYGYGYGDGYGDGDGDGD